MIFKIFKVYFAILLIVHRNRVFGDCKEKRDFLKYFYF